MKKIAIIGASYLQLPLVRKAKEMGLEVHCFAWADGAVCKEEADFFYPISILEKEQILDVCKQVGIHGITSIASDAVVPTISYVAEHLGLISNKYEDARLTTDKYVMRKRFSESNVLCPQYVLAKEGYNIEHFNFPLIVKPTDRSGSRGVKKVEMPTEVKDAVVRAQHESFTHQAIVEEYITGKEVSVETISWQGEHYILAITDKVTTGEPYFVELEHHQPSKLSDEIQKRIKRETIKALNALNVKYGASHAEFKITSDGNVYAIELGARMGGDFIGAALVQLSTGYDFLQGVIDIALGQFTEPTFGEPNYAGVYFLCEETRNLLPIIQHASANKEIVVAEITDETLRSVQSSADRSGYFIYQSQHPFEL